MPPPPERFELRTRRVSDIAIAVIGVGLGALFVWSALDWSWTMSDGELRGLRGGAIVAAFRGVFGPAGLALVFGVIAFYLGCLGLGALWRLIDRRPAIAADGSGLYFHPSLHPAFVPWAKVVAIELTAASSPQFSIALADRFWSTFACFTARSIKLDAVVCGLKPEAAAEAVRDLNGRRPGSAG